MMMANYKQSHLRRRAAYRSPLAEPLWPELGSSAGRSSTPRISLPIAMDEAHRN